ncbi:MAG: hypothetical protein E7630_03590 [Ruminococcaceae bacterium]|nr:hypothetical protein [Oscillospiraceae bacterium]
MRCFVPLFVLFWLLIFLVACEATPDYVFPLTDRNVSDTNTIGTDSEVDSRDDHDSDAPPDGGTEIDPPDPDAPPDSDTETDSSDPDAPSGITVLSLTDNVSRGSNAFLSIRGIPGITYQIEVYYSTTISQAKGLEPKTADHDGTVAWSWRVGSKTKAGSHRIVIRGENGDSLTLYFTTTAQS